jgi:signal transduction histidine kinase
LGLNRWNDGQITTYGKPNGLPRGVFSLFEDDGGTVWLSTPGGIGRFESGRFNPLKSVSIHGVENIVGDRPGSLWATSLEQGLIHLIGDDIVDRIPWPSLGHKDFAYALAFDPVNGGLWLGFRNGGLAFFRDRQVRETYTTAQGLGGGIVSQLHVESDGSVWAATAGGLSRISNRRVTTLNSRNGLPCDTVHWMIEDDQRSAWLYSACGLVRVDRAELAAWIADPNHPIRNTVFDSYDGVRSQGITMGYSPHVTKSADGRVWFGTEAGASIIDPRNLAFNILPPSVRIEQIIADRKVVTNRQVPALTRDLEIDYTALSLVASEKNRFKYKLEGHDRHWQEAGNRRQAFYNDLPPRQYRFHVIASNNSGVWNEMGDTLEFSIAPAYYQTSWFYAACVAAFLAMLWGLYRLRLYQIRREFNAQLDGRVEERMRVARELHDTLLQSFQAALIQMQAARNIFARRPEKAEESMEKAITIASGAVVEGRSAIQDLRAHPADEADLPQLLTAAGQELAHSAEAPAHPPAFAVTVEGERQDLQPLLQDEVYRIARELLRNAFRHAEAGRIEVEIRFDSRHFRMHIRDDGKGIDAEVLKAGGRTGHYGLPGMRERANQFGGKLEFWSEAGAGTEAVLTVPAAAAYTNGTGGAFSFLRRKLWIHER